MQIQNPDGHHLKKIVLLLALLLPGFVLLAQDRRSFWVDSVFQTLTVPEKIGQVFMIPVSVSLKPGEVALLMNKVKTYQVGGLFFTGGGPVRVAGLLNRMQATSKVPMLTGLTTKWSIGPTVDSTMSFPSLITLGAIQNDSLIYSLGKTIAGHMKKLGLQINFVPPVDIYRQQPDYYNYFSDDTQRVISKSVSLIKGMQDMAVMVCVPLNQLDTSSTSPTREFIRQGAGGLLAGNFRTNPREVIQKTTGFEGLIFSEFSPLPGKSGKKRKEAAWLLAFADGSDMQFIEDENLPAAVKMIQKMLKKNALLGAQLDRRVKKVLGAKYDAGLTVRRRLNTDNLVRRLNSADDNLLRYQLDEAAVTVVKNSASSIPIKSLQGKSFASLSIGVGNQNEFNRFLAKYDAIQTFSVRSLADTTGLEAKLTASDVIIIGIYPSASAIQLQLLPIIKRLAAHREVILCHFGNPAGLKDFEDLSSVIAAYTDESWIQKIAAQIIFGGMGAKGVLPITVRNSLREGQSILTPAFDRLSYGVPEAVGMDSETLEQIKSVAREAIDMKATPGCHVLVSRHGKVVYEQSFGSLTYENKTPVTDETIYDLASVTKVSATLQAIMYLYEKGLVDINKKASVYLPELRTSNKRDFILKDILTHQAGLWPFLPFWTETVKDSMQLPTYYSKEGSPDYPFPVASNLYAVKSMKDSLWRWIIKARIRENPGRTPYDYRYSDMGFYIMQHLAEKLLQQPMEEFLRKNIYESLGAYTTGYLPRRRFPETRIAPTEYDKLFRRSLLIGYVHDQGAAMHGGIAGHAGLFSTANDLAKLGQMWLQKGTYGGHQYFKPETIEFFTQKQYENSRRGLGWDKPTISDPNGPTSLFSSPKTFGHTGFTGISIWVDPEFDLVFIFFSNRVYPDMNNNKILNANIRPRIQDVVYRAIFDYCAHEN